MGWCHEFGVEIEARCGHPMEAGPTSCSCPECGTVCLGQFDGGCEAVWARGLRPDAPARPATYSPAPALALAGANGTGPGVGVELGGQLNGAQVEEVPANALGRDAVVVGPGRSGVERRSFDQSGGPSQNVGAGPAPDAVELSKRLAQVEAALTALAGRIDRLATGDGLTSSVGGTGDGIARRDHAELTSQQLPLAVRAARALLADARKRAVVAGGGRASDGDQPVAVEHPPEEMAPLRR